MKAYTCEICVQFLKGSSNQIQPMNHAYNVPLIFTHTHSITLNFKQPGNFQTSTGCSMATMKDQKNPAAVYPV